jgi:tight adherence protein B
MLPTIVFLFFLCLTYAGYLFATRDSEARRLRMRQRLSEALHDAPEQEGHHVQLARDGEMSGIPFVAVFLERLSLARRLNRMISQADVQITVTRLLAFSGAAGLMAFLAAFTVTGSPILLLVFAAVAASVPLVHISWRRKKRLAKFLEHLPGALDLMSRALSAGHPFSETLQVVADEMPEPVATEFRVTFEEQKLGLSLKQALENLSERVPLLDLQLCITAILIQRETGGNLGEILDKVSTTIRERFKIMADLRSMTSATRGSAWILCLLPLVVALLMTAANPEYTGILWSDPRGHKMLMVAFAMQVMGMLLVRRIMNIKI